MPDSRPVVVISEFMDKGAIESRRTRHTVYYDPDLVDRPGELRVLLANARALIVRNRTQVDAELLDSAPKLEVVGRLGVGLDNIDQEKCFERGIAVHPATGANARAVAEYVIAAALLALRGVFAGSAALGAGQWPRAALSAGREAGGKSLGLVGFGDIGQHTARLARALDLRVVAHDPAFADAAPLWAEHGVTPLGISALLAQSDIVSLHLPLNAATRGLFDREKLARMKSGAILINTARGAIVDETALADALRSGHLGGAAIDVFEQEPLPAGSPLAGLPNAWLTPHVAGLSAEANVRVSALIAQRVGDSLNYP